MKDQSYDISVSSIAVINLKIRLIIRERIKHYQRKKTRSMSSMWYKHPRSCSWVTEFFTKMNGKLLRNILSFRPIYALKCNYSHNVEDIFKFYSDDVTELKQNYRPLDEKDYSRFLSQRALKRQPALTRQITSLAYKVGKDMISLAEGMPNESIFPFTRLEMTTRAGGKIVLEENELAPALQYVPSQGLPSLVTELRDFQRVLHRPPSNVDVLVTNGSQHGIYQCVELLVDPGDVVITTEYSYTGVFSALRPYQPEILGIPEDEDGLIPETLESILYERLSRGQKMPKVMYLIPNGNNPTGTTLSEYRRRQIYEMACKYDFLIIEDDPYMFLNYTDRSPPSFLSLDACGRVVRLDSLSKVVSSGLRAGWVTAPPPLLLRAELHTQAELLHSCTLAQVLLQRLVSDRDALATHLRWTQAFYRRRRDALGAALHAAALPVATPAAGLFHWVHVPGVDDVYNMVFQTAFNRGLMLVPGQAFLLDNSAPSPYVRLTFSKIQMKDMDTSVRLLAAIIEEEQKLTLQKQRQRLATEQ